MPKTKKDFKAQLVEAFLSADIPLKKIRNPLIVQLFTDLGQAVPSETMCREHVHELAESEQGRIKELLMDKKVFLVVDKSEIDKKKYLNVLVGDINVPEKTYLLDCSVVETVNQNVMCAKIDDCLRNLDIPRENFVLLLSDAASYMTAHMLHNCAEKVRSYFTEVDNLVARVKAATVKNKTRRSLFKDIGSPPEPVVTRWGTWLEAAEYYADNLTEVTKIVNSFDGDGIIVNRAKDAVNDASIAASLMKIKRDYVELPKIIKKMESSKYTIREAHADITGKFNI